MEPRTRSVEVYFGYAHGGAKMWDTAVVPISVDIAEEDIESAACEAFLGSEDRIDPVVFCGVYHILSEDDEEED